MCMSLSLCAQIASALNTVKYNIGDRNIHIERAWSADVKPAVNINFNCGGFETAYQSVQS